jgi:hypothetical protein
MPFKKQIQSQQGDPAQGNVHQKIADLERQLKRLNTMEVEVKRIGQIEKQLGLINIQNNESKRERQTNLFIQEPIQRSMQEAIRMELEPIRRSMQDAVQAELEPIQRSMQEIVSRLYITEKRLAEAEQELQLYKDRLKRNMESDGARHVPSTFWETEPDELRDAGATQSDDAAGIGEKSNGESHLQPIIIYHQFKVDKMYVDHFDQENTIRNLGIRKLSGKLNIGTSFEKGMVPAEFLEEWQEVSDKMKEKKEELQKAKAEEENTE